MAQLGGGPNNNGQNGRGQSATTGTFPFFENYLKMARFNTSEAELLDRCSVPITDAGLLSAPPNSLILEDNSTSIEDLIDVEQEYLLQTLRGDSDFSETISDFSSISITQSSKHKKKRSDRWRRRDHAAVGYHGANINGDINARRVSQHGLINHKTIVMQHESSQTTPSPNYKGTRSKTRLDDKSASRYDDTKECSAHGHVSKESSVHSHRSKESSMHSHTNKENSMHSHRSKENSIHSDRSKQNSMHSHRSKENSMHSHRSKENSMHSHRSKESSAHSDRSKESSAHSDRSMERSVSSRSKDKASNSATSQAVHERENGTTRSTVIYTESEEKQRWCCPMEQNSSDSSTGTSKEAERTRSRSRNKRSENQHRSSKGTKQHQSRRKRKSKQSSCVKSENESLLGRNMRAVPRRDSRKLRT